MMDEISILNDDDVKEKHTPSDEQNEEHNEEVKKEEIKKDDIIFKKMRFVDKEKSDVEEKPKQEPTPPKDEEITKPPEESKEIPRERELEKDIEEDIDDIEDEDDKQKRSKLDEEFGTPRSKLIALLKDEKIPSRIFITRLFFADPNNQKLPQGFKILDDLLKECEVSARQRKKVIWMFFDKNPETAGLTFTDDDDEDEKKSNLISGSLKGNDEIIEYPVRNPDGSFVKDAKGVPITVKLTKSQLYWQMQEEKSMMMHKQQNQDGNAFEKFMAMMMQQQDQNLKIVLSLMSDRVKRAEERANFDPKDYVKSQLEFAQLLGFKKEDTKDEIDRIKAQGEVATNLVEKAAGTIAGKLGPEIRESIRDGVKTLKEISEIETDKRRTENENIIIPNIPKNHQESIFKKIEEVVSKPNGGEHE